MIMPQRKIFSLFAGVAVCILATFTAVEAMAERVMVGVDQAQLMRVDVPVDAIIIGNPAIADASVYDQTTLIITGKSFGETNMIILDSLGKIVREVNLTITTPSDTLTMYKGAGRASYTCAPVCEPTLRAGDSVEGFKALQEQVTGTLALGRAQANN